MDNRMHRMAAVSAFLGALFLYAVSSQTTARAQQNVKPSPTGELLTYFYKDPRPERFIGFLTDYKEPKWEAYPPVVGTLAVIFRKHPDRIEQLIPAELTSMTAETVVAALQLSGNQQMIAKIRPRLQNVARDQTLAQLFANLPSRIEDLRIQTPTHLDIVWGAALASGDARYVRMNIDFYAAIANRSEPIAIDVARVALSMGGKPVTDLRSKYDDATALAIIYAGVALWGITSNARQHAFAAQAVKTYVAEHPGTPATKGLVALGPKPK